MRYAAAGHVDRAFRCVFSLGNEQSLLGLLARLESEVAWPKLPEAEARYLAGLLVRLLCKDPLGRPAAETSAWLETLVVRMPGGLALLEDEDHAALHGALFSLSGTPGAAGRSAACVYYALFQEPQDAANRWA
uniref:Uncharacterized protein n=1 Tax=Zooxanthella nutricula TaxID=1333877 RepID=A0A7S2NGJ4_9DINO